MADLAVGAVTKLLGLIHNEVQLLDSVKGDVQFIKEEMESINSFLARLAKAGPGAAGDAQEDEQIRTWMKQVRELAHDYSNFIDLYVQRCNPALQSAARGGILRYLGMVSWFAKKMYAQHNAPNELRKLKERARDVSERRARYDVKVPETKEAGGGAGPSSQDLTALVAGDDDDDDGLYGDGDGRYHHAGQRRRALEPRFLEDHCAEKLAGWLNNLPGRGGHEAGMRVLPSIAIVAPDADNSSDMAREALDLEPIHFDRTVWINLQEVHAPWDLPLLLQELLCYILQKCELQAKHEEADRHQIEKQYTVKEAFSYREAVLEETMKKIQDHQVHVDNKIEEIMSNIGPLDKKWSKYIPDKHKHFAMLYQALLKIFQDQQGYRILSMEGIVRHATYMLQSHMEAEGDPSPVVLETSQYKEILQEVFLDSKPQQEAAAAAVSTSAAPAALSEDAVKQIIHILQQLLPKPEQPEGNSYKEQKSAATGIHGGTENTMDIDDATAAEIKEAKLKMREILRALEYQLLIKGIADRINEYLSNNKTLIVLQDDGDYMPISAMWEETRKALSLIDCTPGSAVIVTNKNSQRAKEFCCPPGEPITYSLVGLYHDIALELTRDKRKQQEGSYDPQILRDILDRCNPHEFAMKVLVHDLYANPNRSSDDLNKLLDELNLHKSSWGASNNNIVNITMLKFSYSTLPREYKTCLVYLAIFPPRYKIRRSTLVGRWVAEGLITKEEWDSALRHGKRCFDALIDRWLIYPNDTDATGEVKNYIMDDLVHEFITKIAKKEHILDARLSHVWARHFSVFSDLRLRASDSIEKLLRKLPKYSSQLQLLKVLDLEGCEFPIEHFYLKNICNNILLLKYLSLRETKVNKLPREINNLRELEILDIRETKVPASHTRDIMLLKLKRLLAGPVRDNEVLCSTAQIPSSIKRMEHTEVLSNVMASGNGDDLEHIRKLFRLRKLGVVIEDKKAHLEKFLRVISDLKDRIQSLSVTLQPTKGGDGTAELSLKDKVKNRLHESKRLERLSINGVTNNKELLSFLTKGGDRLAKVNLNDTLLNQETLEDLAAVPKLSCVRLQHVEYTEHTLTFRQHDFKYLKFFIVEHFRESKRKTDVIEFEKGTAPELQKIVLSHTSIKYLCGVGALEKLEELELIGNEFLVSLLKDEAAPDDELCTEGMLAFKKEEFRHLKHLLVYAQLSTDIIFEDGAAPLLTKIVLYLEKIKSLHGVSSLPRLTELVLNGNNKDILLTLLKEKDNRIAKVTLRGTLLKQDDLQVLAMKPNLQCLELLDNSYCESELTFNKDEFPKLTLLAVDCPTINKITFADRAAPKMEKITWIFSRIETLSGIKNLPKLNMLKLFGDRVPYQVTEDIKALRIRYTLKMTEQQQKEKQEKEAQEDQDDDTPRFPFPCFT